MLAFVKKYPKQIDAFILILGFVIGSNLLTFFKQAGLDEEIRQMIFEAHGFHYLTPTIAGFIIGVTLFWLEYVLFRKLIYWDRRWVLLTKFLVVSMLIVLTSVFIQTFVNWLVNGMNVQDSFMASWYFVRTDIFMSVYVYLMLLGVTLSFFRELGNRFGHGIILNYILGKYREPVEEDRIFMFLDLNKSTAIAEQLGHVKYSRFLNKCFSDLSELLPEFEGEVYQYVGDEAIITWRVDHISNPLSPIALFAAFETKLEQNKSLYLSKFDWAPTFKASINCGRVSVSMVGGARKEMAFHGDVLNNASRVFEQCSRLKKKLLITESFSRLITHQKNVSLVFLKDLVLRGKNTQTPIYELVL